MFMVMFVSKDADQASEVLDLWIKNGIGGVTILESAGLSQLNERFDDVGILFSLSSLLRRQEVHHRTLFSAVKDDETLDRVVQATTAHVGDWSRPDVGVLFVWPLTVAYGLDKTFPPAKAKKQK
jgi:hypothetical protein